VAVAVAAAPLFAQTPIPPDLKAYVSKADAAYAWSVKDTMDVEGNKVTIINQVSQTWQGIDWKHDLIVVVPKDAKPTKTLLVWNQGGTASPQNSFLAVEIAKRVKAPVAFLFGIPNQPIPSVGGEKKEDALIAETFDRFLKTKDPTWPLLFPMAKSLVRTMDTLQAFAKKEWQYDVEKFVVTGASKRGWTSWLTAATGDKRVKAIAPLVIDTLNFQKQMPNQLKSFNGKYSEMIHDYEEKNLLPLPDTDDARRLWAMVDPWVYRDMLTLPKMIINGTNDPYWAQDALNIYWDDLKGEKYVCYVPNAGHGLRVEEEPNKLLGLPRKEQEERRKEIKLEPFPTKAINTLSAFYRHQIDDVAMPKLEWKMAGDDAKRTLSISVDQTPKSITVWTAESDTPDFRKSKWVAKKVDPSQAYHLVTNAAGAKHTAMLAEYEFEYAGISHTLCTQIAITAPKK
jgi:PhoPQ-activated pathogenicity-related protein